MIHFGLTNGEHVSNGVITARDRHAALARMTHPHSLAAAVQFCATVFPHRAVHRAVIGARSSSHYW